MHSSQHSCHSFGPLSLSHPPPLSPLLNHSTPHHHHLPHSYLDAARVFNGVLAYINRVKQYHARSVQYDQILKKNEQMWVQGFWGGGGGDGRRRVGAGSMGAGYACCFACVHHMLTPRDGGDVFTFYKCHVAAQVCAACVCVRAVPRGVQVAG